MRVAFLVNEFPSLSETFVLDQITGLLDRGCTVDIYANRPAGVVTVHPDVETYNLRSRTIYRPDVPDNYGLRLLKASGLLRGSFQRSPRASWRALDVRRYGRQAATLRLLYEMTACLDKEPYDIIHAHFGPNGLMAAMLRDIGILHGRLVTTFYGYDISLYLRQSRRRSYEFLFRSGDLFVAISESMRRRLIELGCPSEKIVLHRLGVDLHRFSPAICQEPDGNRTRLVTISRLVPKKGIEYAIRAVAELAEAGYHMAYTIVGDGLLHEEIERLIEELAVGDVVALAGWQTQEDVLSTLSRSDIMLAPSVTSDEGDEEGTPVALMEAAAVGIPVIATHHSGIPEVVESGVSGLLVPERDVEALAEALLYLIEQPGARCEMGRAGRQIAEARHDADRLNDGLVTIYRDLLSGSGWPAGEREEHARG